ncbi:unnamed protein product [Gulo gulo]|uniref:Uncharacterized protein n=1 Tax=Gulo gulo TaxID=48420 RepID=A0A9X9PY27_GULGU|nr:unnamed protein product [Gulo gulo]
MKLFHIVDVNSKFIALHLAVSTRGYDYYYYLLIT